MNHQCLGYYVRYILSVWYYSSKMFDYLIDYFNIILLPTVLWLNKCQFLSFISITTWFTILLLLFCSILYALCVLIFKYFFPNYFFWPNFFSLTLLVHHATYFLLPFIVISKISVAAFFIFSFLLLFFHQPFKSSLTVLCASISIHRFAILPCLWVDTL